MRAFAEQSVEKQPQSCVVEDLSTAQSLTYKSLDQEADKITAWAITTPWTKQPLSGPVHQIVSRRRSG
jgi:hypothetical protein